MSKSCEGIEDLKYQKNVKLFSFPEYIPYNLTPLSRVYSLKSNVQLNYITTGPKWEKNVIFFQFSGCSLDRRQYIPLYRVSRLALYGIRDRKKKVA